MDFVTDRTGAHLARIQSLVGEEIPDYVKKASICEDDLVDCQDSEFANPTSREFPISDPGHVWLSYAYVKSAGVSDATVIDGIKQAATVFGLEDELEKLDAKIFSEAIAPKLASAKEMEDTAPKAQALITIDFGKGNKKASGLQNFFVVSGAHDFDDACREMLDSRDVIPEGFFREGCRNAVKLASVLGIPSGEIIEDIKTYGTERVVDYDVLDAQLELRARFLKAANSPAVELYEGLGDAIKEAAGQEKNLDRWAEMMVQMDSLNLSELNRAEVMSPWDIMESGGTKLAANQAMDRWAILQEAPVPLTAIAELPDADISDFFAGDLKEQVIGIKTAAANMDTETVRAELANLDDESGRRLLKMLVAA